MTFKTIHTAYSLTAMAQAEAAGVLINLTRKDMARPTASTRL